MAFNKQTKMYEGYIYAIFNDIYPEKVYIGQTTETPKKRWYGHRGQIIDHSYTDKLHNAMALYGVEHFGMQVLADYKFPTREKLLEILDYEEKRMIKKFNSYYNGYNSTTGGRDSKVHQMRAVSKYDLYGNYIASYESINDLLKEFDAVNCIYECCSGKCKYAYGYIWRYKEDNINKFSLPDENEIKEAITRSKTLNTIYKYDYKGNMIASYKNIKDVCEKEQTKYSQIYKCCTGQNIRVGKFVYRFYDEPFDKYPTTRKNNKIIEQYDMNGNLVNHYDSCIEASKETGISNRAINRICLGKSVSGIVGGYKWKYA